MIWSDVTSNPISPASVLDRVGEESDGAVILFVGTVRDQNDGRPVSGMEYHGYEEMAREQLDAIAKEASALVDGGSLAVVHRLGVLALGDVSVAIAVSSPHRKSAFEASRFVIEEIKKRLPVWKKEHYLDGRTGWVEGVDPAPEAVS
ncbi:MAG: molybdenum cofactor biosynthesis protein MoaE [Gemmatimonadetes bacterium]|nr:molybdenum cofactor biosynthesis protein MoaE [Gemmatimonadota bacterium]